MSDREIEWQFEAPDLELVRRRLEETTHERFTVTAAGCVTQADRYLDTEDRRLARAGFALRIREVDGNGAEATLKSLGSAVGATGLRSRRELSEQVHGTDPEVLHGASGPVAERVRAVAGLKPLQHLFDVRTSRALMTLATEGVESGEIALDETAVVPADGAETHLHRVEVEVPEASLATFEPFVDALRAACALQPAELSKYETGLRAAGLSTPLAHDCGSTHVDAEMTIGAVALAVLRRHFSALLEKEPGTRLGDDNEELHDMRVASRRLRAALSLFADVLPASLSALADEPAWIGRQLGHVRDLDVQLEQLDAWIEAAVDQDADALRTLRSVLQEQRAEARRDMLEALDSPRYDAFVRTFGDELRQPRAAGDAAARPALAVAPDLIERRWNAVRKNARRLGRSSPPQDYHRLRIRCKRLRYALEFLTDVYAGRASPVLKQLVALQDILGLHQDAFVAVERLRALVGERGTQLGPPTVFAMGEIAERYRQGVKPLQAQVVPAFRRVEGKRWASFQKHVDGLRPADVAAEG